MDLNEVLNSSPLDDLLKTIHKKAKTGSKDVGAYIRAIFQGSNDNTDESEKRRFETFKSSLLMLQIPELSSSTCLDIVGLLLLKTDSLCTSNLMRIAEFFIDTAHESETLCSKWLEIFSKVLSCLCQRDSIVYQGTDMSGADLKKNAIVSLFNENLTIPCILQIINVLKDIDLTDDEMKIVTNNLLKHLPKIDKTELPSYVYQLLLLSKKGQRSKILQAIIAYFIREDAQLYGKSSENNLSEDIIGNDDDMMYRQTEGTVILMICVNSRHDQSVAKELVALFKKLIHKPNAVLSPFLFASALSLSQIQSNANELFDYLRKSISAAFQLNNKKEQSIWMRETIPMNVNILELVKEAIRCSQFGWDHVCQGLVKFGFSLIETFGPRYVAGNAVKSLSEEGAQLGCHIIKDTFKSHRIVRTDILDQILSRIVTKTQKPVKHYIDLFAQIVHNDPLFHLEVLPKLVEIMDYIHLLPHCNAVDILQALAPLLRISMPLKDTLMLVLRKALFHRDTEARKVAVSGYLMILKKLNSIGKVSLSQSQTSMSSQASSASLISTQVRADVYVSAGNPSARTMCLEIMGLLKRALMQHCAVRQLLYEGCYDLVLHNKCLKDIVLELLFRQFEKYYESNANADVPLQLSLCIKEEKGALTQEEPLAHLLMSVHLILQLVGDVSDEDEYDLSAQKMFEDAFLNLTKKLSTIDITLLEISKKDDDAPAENVLANLVLNVYELLLENSLMQMNEYSEDSCEDFLNLYHKYKEILDLVTPKKVKKTPKAKMVVTSSNMQVTLRFYAVLLEALFFDATFKHQEGLNLLRKDGRFVMHIINSCNQRLLKLSECGIHDGFSEKMKNSFDFTVRIAKVYFKTYSGGLQFEFPSLEWERISVHFAEGLSLLISYINNFQTKNSKKFLTGICGDNKLTEIAALQHVLKAIQKAIVQILQNTEDDLGLKDIPFLLSVIKILYALFHENFNDDVYKWLKQICVQQVFQNVTLSKSFMSLCLTLGHQQSNFLTFLKEIAFDIHYHLEDIDPDVKVNGNPKYNLITPEVSRTIVQNLISNIDIILEEIESVLTYLKANSTISLELLSSLNTDSSNHQEIENAVSNHLHDLVLVYNEILQTSVSADNTSTLIFKMTSRLYKIFGTLTKYYLLCHTKLKTSVLPPSFEKLVKLTHTKLTPCVYSFITYIQLISEGNGKKKTKTNMLAMKAMREIKTVPALVFAIESYEKDLIVLSKKYNRNLMNHMKLSTARDFRINAAAIAPPEPEDSPSIQDEELDSSDDVVEAEAQNTSDKEMEDPDEITEADSDNDGNNKNIGIVVSQKPSHSASKVADNRSVLNETKQNGNQSRLNRKRNRAASESNDEAVHDKTSSKGKNKLDKKANFSKPPLNQDNGNEKQSTVKRKRLGIRTTTKKT